ncbi:MULTISPECIES: YheC/YheD family protein [Paenibacillus]|jgi:glutathione synthase/RimK-type ligase-like ATP-grasp enzyme|uniref:YheC/YheD family protein n=1 Tax=Paenibacillus TaxID=44249 RepID=UPI00054C2D2B|nr:MULTISPECIES: YheC/YheD family protein [Paenibacillus]AIW42300.1 endospore coat-associated protein YheC [Paenibacillus polymyxa CR1]APB73647.1 endospore coat-associated protein YheC [Paenibacillus polymyxa]MXO76318.1 YheC/YheD family protein [Paenibacillus sp. OT2-17]ALA44571.1 endospore coat-associated protein YheC [Paenibacillus peoriae]APQ61851.1 endospore coat-associated protein YheC [Paenibacillus polymyxa]
MHIHVMCAKTQQNRGIFVPIGKMIQYKEMRQHPILRSHLPETRWISNARTLRMLDTYRTVFIKPNYGSGGTGIIRAKKLGRKYEIRCGSSRRVVRSHAVRRAVRTYRRPHRRYLVQQGLKLAKYKGSIFDARVYMQKPESEWVISGITGRVAAPRKVVTNYRKGGHAAPLSKVLLRVFKNDRTKMKEILDQITELSRIIADTIDTNHPVRELGIDLAIEKSGQIWIIEANPHPGHMLFRQLPNHKMIRNILRNKRRIHH